MIRTWIDLNLRSLSQVMLQNNPWTGLFFLTGIIWSTFATNSYSLIIGALLGLFVANSMSMLLKFNQKNILQGLFGYNGVLIGVGVLIFFESAPITYLLIVIGSGLSAILISKWPKGFPILTFPFVIITWLIFACLEFSSPELALHIQNVEVAPVGFRFYSDSFFKSFSQVFLLDQWITGAIFFLALAISSLSTAFFASFGALVSLLIVLLSGADVKGLEGGLYGYNAVLTAIALGNGFYKASMKSTFYALVGVVITLIIQVGLSLLMSRWGIPILTAPFVFAVWIVLGAKLYSTCSLFFHGKMNRK